MATLLGVFLMNLLKAFDCIPHDLLTAKLDSNGLDRNLLKQINSYLDNRKQCVRINNINSDFNVIILGVSQGSVVAPILYNAFLMIFSFYATCYSSQLLIAKTFDKIKKILESESECPIEWFTRTYMFVNPERFKAFVIDQKREQTTQMKRYKLPTKIFKYYNVHISNICKSAANQLNASVRLKIFLGSNERQVLVNSFVLSNFNYCPLVWLVSSSTSLRKIENLHKKALRSLLNNYASSYKQLWQKFSKAFLNLRNHRAFSTAFFKAMIGNEIFERSLSNKKPIKQNYKRNVVTPKTNQVREGPISLKSLALKIWNSLSASIKSSENFGTF